MPAAGHADPGAWTARAMELGRVSGNENICRTALNPDYRLVGAAASASGAPARLALSAARPCALAGGSWPCVCRSAGAVNKTLRSTAWTRRTRVPITMGRGGLRRARAAPHLGCDRGALGHGILAAGRPGG